MRKKIMKFAFTALLLLFVAIGYSQPPQPPSGAGHGASGNQNGGSAPIGGGTIILLILGATYSGEKTYHYFKDKKE